MSSSTLFVNHSCVTTHQRLFGIVHATLLVHTRQKRMWKSILSFRYFFLSYGTFLQTTYIYVDLPVRHGKGRHRGRRYIQPCRPHNAARPSTHCSGMRKPAPRSPRLNSRGSGCDRFARTGCQSILYRQCSYLKLFKFNFESQVANFHEPRMPQSESLTQEGRKDGGGGGQKRIQNFVLGGRQRIWNVSRHKW